jgi:cytochrome c-type biogenesis protein
MSPLGVLIVFGLHFLGVFRIGFLYREARIETRGQPHARWPGPMSWGWPSALAGRPASGPALAAILMVASGMGDLWRGGLLLLVYGLSMTLPFVVAALFAGPFLAGSPATALMGHVEKAMGVMLIVFGMLIATNSVNLIADWMIRNFDWSATLT